MTEYYRCPYCSKNVPKVHGHKAPKSLGKFKIQYEKHNHVLLMQCLKCLGVFRLSLRGVPLLWSDMTKTEKRAFKLQNWVKTKMERNKDQNGTQI